jgi:ElaB/YqjD/DUF883 family membrane-anchored ribosome-binding protein
MNMKNELEIGTEALSASRDTLSKDIVALAGEASNLLKSFSGQKLDSAKEALSGAQSAVSDGAKEFAGVANEYVNTHPWKAMGAAAAAGVLLGLLLARR